MTALRSLPWGLIPDTQSSIPVSWAWPSCAILHWPMMLVLILSLNHKHPEWEPRLIKEVLILVSMLLIVLHVVSENYSYYQLKVLLTQLLVIGGAGFQKLFLTVFRSGDGRTPGSIRSTRNQIRVSRVQGIYLNPCTISVTPFNMLSFDLPVSQALNCHVSCLCGTHHISSFGWP